MKLEIENKNRQCPRCKEALTAFQFNHYQLDRCSCCEGLWLEPDKFKVLTSEFDVYRDDNSDPLFIRKPTPKAEGYLPCACCSKLMTRQNFKDISGVIIDLCIACGIWLDKNELKQIRSFVASGGLGRSQDRQLDKQSQQIQALDDRLSDVELMEKMLHKFSVKRIFFRGF
ncbi:MAG: zf-TFIIB domain-containing protein [Colwellia sp.]|nr:zf-TFIIB domain-containing protein [Colwellia sp.]